VDGDRHFKFVTQVNSSKSQPEDDKSSLKGAWSGNVNRLNFGAGAPTIAYVRNG